MSRDPRYDILFEPVKIGPVTSKNRFFQVPHCTGMGSNWPNAHAALRGQRAEGGWGVVCTEEVMIHPTSDELPVSSMRLWDDSDIPDFALAVEKVHEHGALFGVELAHGGLSRANLTSRIAPLAPSHQANKYATLPQARGMDLYDIAEFRRWHSEAAKRAVKAGADIVYVYCAHNIALPMHFLLPRYNRRNDAYGGKLENRVRLLRELLEDTREAIGDKAALALRFAVDERMGADGLQWQEEGCEVVEMLAELPDLWDVNVSGWEHDSKTSRFSEEGFQEDVISGVKALTTKPVVGVGRYTSPDSMVRVIKSGIMDFIGAARPAIADPFLPKKIENGRIDDIRECIGCNMCVSGNIQAVPIRCTQNPIVGEEWRRDWHPETVPPKGSDDQVLIVGGGPAGLEAARVLGERGYPVTLAEREKQLGGRVTFESKLPGLAAWARVRDWRIGQLNKLTNVDVYLESLLDDNDVMNFGAPHVVFATGSTWRRDGVGVTNRSTIPGAGGGNVHGPIDVMDGRVIDGPVLIFDDDHHTMGGLLAEKLLDDSLEVVLVTPSTLVSEFTTLTLEQAFIQTRLLERGAVLHTQKNLTAIEKGHCWISCNYTGRETEVEAANVVLVTARLPNEAVYHRFAKHPDIMELADIKTVSMIGDCLAPQTIAAAVHDGHLYAREFDAEPSGQGDVPYRRERMILES